LPRLIAFLEEKALVGACGPKLSGLTVRPAFAFGSDPTLYYLLMRACARLGLCAPLHDWETLDVQPVDWVSGACLLVRRSALEQIAASTNGCLCTLRTTIFASG